jgi:hypothetical protein
MKHAIATDPRNEAIREGMLTMYEDGLRKAVRGITTIEEVLRATPGGMNGSVLSSRPPRARHADPCTMPIYRYRAVNAAGDVTPASSMPPTGEIVERLRDQGMLPMQVARATGALAGRSARANAAPRRAWFIEASAAISCSRSPASSRRCSAPACRSTARSRS